MEKELLELAKFLKKSNLDSELNSIKKLSWDPWYNDEACENCAPSMVEFLGFFSDFEEDKKYAVYYALKKMYEKEFDKLSLDAKFKADTIREWRPDMLETDLDEKDLSTEEESAEEES